MSKLAVCSLLLALWLAPTWAAATTINLSASIDAAQARAGAGTPSAGLGSATLTFDTTTNLLSWSGSFSDLRSAYLSSGFHGAAAPDGNAVSQLGIPVVLDNGNLSGAFNGSATLSAGQATDLLNDLWYINIPSNLFTGGEIRGQVLVPEPTTAALLVLATTLLLAHRRPI